MKRTRAVVVLDAGLSSIVTVGFASRRSPPPALVADTAAVDQPLLDQIARWYGSDLVYDPEPALRAFAEANDRGLPRVYVTDSAVAPEVPDGIDLRIPIQGATPDELVATALQLKVPVHLSPRCDSPACRCTPSCDQVDHAYARAGVTDPWRIAQGLPAADAMAPPAPTPVHLVGTRFCGSTLLGLLLEAHPEIFVAGELDTITHDYRKRLACTCHVPINVCGFWAPLLATRGSANVDASNLDSVIGDAARRSGASVVIDSSKRPAWVRELPAEPSRRIIHIVRDGRAFLASARRWDGMDAAQAANLWRTTQLDALELAQQFGSHAFTVRYEDLAKAPELVTAKIASWLDVSRNPALDGNYTTQLSHQVRGNPMRFQRGPIKIDERWKTELNATDLATFEHVAGELSEALGYPLNQ